MNAYAYAYTQISMHTKTWLSDIYIIEFCPAHVRRRRSTSMLVKSWHVHTAHTEHWINVEK